jgi:hypothetical protein
MHTRQVRKYSSSKISVRLRRSCAALFAAVAGAMLLNAGVRAAAADCLPGGLACFEPGAQGDIWQQLTPFGSAIDFSKASPFFEPGVTWLPLYAMPTRAQAQTWTDPVTQCAYDGQNTSCGPFTIFDNVRWLDAGYTFDYNVNPSFIPQTPADTTGRGTLRFAGGTQPPMDRLFYPFATAVDTVNGTPFLYVADTYNNRLLRYSLSGASPTLMPFPNTVGDGIAGMEPNRLNSPQGIAIDGAHHILVADRNNNRVQVFNSDGTLFLSVPAAGVTGVGVQPGITVGPGGSGAGVGVVAVTDEFNSLVYVYDSMFNRVKTYGSLGNADPQNFQSPTGVRVRVQGNLVNLYVADLGNNRVHIVGDALETVGLAQHFAFGTPVAGNDASISVLSSPYDLDFNHLGQLMIADTGNQRMAAFDVKLDLTNVDPLQRFSSKFVYELGAKGSPLGALNGYPRGVTEYVTTDPADGSVNARLFVINTTLYQVQWFQVPKLAIVDLKVVSTGAQGDVSFGVVVPKEKPTAFGVLAGLTSDAGATVVIDPPTSTDGNPVARMDAGNIARFTFHYTDNRPAGSATPTFTATATANTGATVAPAKDVRPEPPCNGCSSRHTIVTNPVDATWFETDVRIRLDGSGGVAADLITPVGLRAIAWEYVKGQGIGGDPGVHYIVPNPALPGTTTTTRVLPVAGAPEASTLSGELVVDKVFEGINTIRYWAIDATGAFEQTSSAIGTITLGHTVTVGIDTHPPKLTCPAMLPQLFVAAATDTAAAPDLSGIIEKAPNDTYSQVPVAGTRLSVGSTTITVTLKNGAGHSTSCPAQVVVVVDKPPVANDDVAKTLPATAVTIDVLANDTDPDNPGAAQVLTIQAVGAPAHGVASIVTGQIVYTPVAGYSGLDTFKYRVNDGFLDSNDATVSVTMAAPPVAQNLTVQTNEDTPVTITLSATDVDSLQLTFATGQLAHGTLGPMSTPVCVPNLTGGSSCTATVVYSPAPDYNGPESFIVKASDDSVPALTSAPATVSISVAAVNDAPEAAATTASATEDAPVTITLSATDIDSSLLTFTTATPAHGTLSAVSPAVCAPYLTAGTSCTATVTYTPAANHNGPDTFTFTATDNGTPAATSANATVSISVAAVNDAPVAASAPASATEDTPSAITLTATDVDSLSLTFALTAPAPAHGSLSAISAPVCAADSNGGTSCTATVVYTPASNYNGPDTLTFTATDDASPALTSAPATVTITVAPVNDAPTASAQSVAAVEDTDKAITLTGDDGDPDVTQTLTFAIAAGPAHGTLIGFDAATGAVTYRPAANYNGPDSFTFTVTDNGTPSLTSAPATVSISVAAVNDAPTATPQVVAATEDTDQPITLTGDDGDPELTQALTFAIAAGPAHGSLVGFNAATGAVAYRPALNYNGPDSFTFTVTDDGTPALSSVAAATVTINVAPVNDAPTTSGASITVGQGAGVSGTVTASDVDGDTLTFAVATPPAKGTVTAYNAANGSFTFTASASASGADSFTYSVSDGHGGQVIGTVSITIIAGKPPVVTVTPLQGTIDEDTSVTLILTAKDPDSTTLTLNTPTALHGTFGPMTQVVCMPFGPGKACGAAIVYTPAPNYNGPETITFTATDGVLTSVPATADLTIRPVNDAPVAVGDSATTAEDTARVIPVLANDTDIDTPPAALKAVIVSQPAHGRAVVNADQTITYTPAANYYGPDSFTYKASDGSLTSAAATVTLTVTPVNDAPVARNDAASVVRGGSVTIAVLANDTDVDGDVLKVVAVTQGAKGAAVLNANGTVTYTPGPSFTTTDSFTYTISDGKGGTATATVVIRVRSHGDGDACDHDERRNGHHSRDGCEHERDTNRRNDGESDRSKKSRSDS